jgi:hypothetical protein
LAALALSESLLRLTENLISDVEGRLANEPISRLFVIEKVSRPGFFQHDERTGHP